MENEHKEINVPVVNGRIVAWEAPEFVHREKGWGWLIVIWISALLLSILALWLYQFSIIGVVTLLVPLSGALALSTQGRIKPEIIRVIIDDEGVTVKGQLYAWDELKGFWLVFSKESQMLFFETTRRLFPIVSIQLGKTDPEMVRTYLIERLPERTDQKEELSERLARYLRF